MKTIFNSFATISNQKKAEHYFIFKKDDLDLLNGVGEVDDPPNSDFLTAGRTEMVLDIVEKNTTESIKFVLNLLIEAEMGFEYYSNIYLFYLDRLTAEEISFVNKMIDRGLIKKLLEKILDTEFWNKNDMDEDGFTIDYYKTKLDHEARIIDEYLYENLLFPIIEQLNPFFPPDSILAEQRVCDEFSKPWDFLDYGFCKKELDLLDYQLIEKGVLLLKANKVLMVFDEYFLKQFDNWYLGEEKDVLRALTKVITSLEEAIFKEAFIQARELGILIDSDQFSDIDLSDLILKIQDERWKNK